MPTPAPMNGQANEATLDQANIAMRSMPWYQDMLKSFGQDPNSVHLSKEQKTAVIRGAQAHGFVIDEGDMQIDDSGNIDKKGHKLRNTLIVAGIAGATIATMGAAGVFAGAGGVGMAGGAAGGAASGAAAAGAGAAGMGVTAGGIATGGLVGGAAGGSALAGGLTGGAALAAAGGAAIPAALGGTLVGTTGGGLAALSAGSTIGGGTALGTTAAGGATALTTMQKISQAAKLANTARSVGSAVSNATEAAGNNRLNQEQLALGANRDNIAGNKAAEDALLGRSLQEGTERKSALIDIARASHARNPSRSIYNTSAPKQYSAEYTDALTALEQRGLARLKADPSYSTDKMTPLKTYNPLDIKDLQGATNTKPGLMERIGQYVGPAMSIYGAYKGK